jgi:hypothetical protein
MSKSMVRQSTTDGQEAKVTRHHQPIQLPQWLVSLKNVYMPVRPIRYPAIPGARTPTQYVLICAALGSDQMSIELITVEPSRSRSSWG